MTITTFGNPSAQNTAPLPAAPQGASTPASKAPVIASEPVVAQQPRPEQLQKAIETMKRSIESKAPNTLDFSVDSSSGKTVVRITDHQTGEMIRQIPSEEMLAIAKSLDKIQQGMLLQQTA